MLDEVDIQWKRRESLALVGKNIDSGSSGAVKRCIETQLDKSIWNSTFSNLLVHHFPVMLSNLAVFR